MSVLLTLPMLVWMVSDMLPGRPLEAVVSARAAQWVQLVLAVPIVFWAAWPFYGRGWTGAKLFRPNMFTLIGIGVLVAFFYSVVATVVPNIFPDSFSAHGDVVGVYFESAAVIVTLVLLGQLLELRARAPNKRGRTRAAGPRAADGVARDGSGGGRSARRTAEGRRRSPRQARREGAARWRVGQRRQPR